MTIKDKTRDEKLQHDVNREETKISGLSFGKTDKYDILQVKKYYLLIKKKVIEQTKFTYYPVGKALEKQTKTIEDQDKKQIKANEDHGTTGLI